MIWTLIRCLLLICTYLNVPPNDLRYCAIFYLPTYLFLSNRYECTICNKRFAQSSNLFRHLRQHTGDLPHQCDQCQKKFMTKPELRNHIVVHTKEKNEICQIWEKAFGTKKSLRTHQRIHSGERNYNVHILFEGFYTGPCAEDTYENTSRLS